MKPTCSRCEKPLSSRYWLHLFFNDGREEKRRCGEIQKDDAPHVAVWIDYKCKRGGKKVARTHPIDRETVVHHNGGFFSLSDMTIIREGDRILMVMPTQMVAGV